MSNASAATIQGPSVARHRKGTLALWIVQVVLAAMVIGAGGSKLAGVPAMVTMFDTIGFGQWFRYVTGAIEVVSGIALLVPSLAAFGALLLIPTMIGAILAHVLVLGGTFAPPAVILVGAVVIAWARRSDLIRAASSRRS